MAPMQSPLMQRLIPGAQAAPITGGHGSLALLLAALGAHHGHLSDFTHPGGFEPHPGGDGNGLVPPVRHGGDLAGYGGGLAPIASSASGIDAAVAGQSGVPNLGFHHFPPAPAEGPTGSHGEMYMQPIRRRPGLAQALAALQQHPGLSAVHPAQAV